MTMHVGVGVMSGTSLDGMDICCVEFVGDEDADNWKHTVIEQKTVPYSAAWRQRLLNAHRCSGEQLMKLNIEYGHYVGEHLRQFMDEHPEIDDIKFIAPHGHTVFHQPHNKFTFQLGEGETIASHLHVPVVTNFRAKDVALGGQGAPLVHVGERHLFSECTMFINLGGISNISLKGTSFDAVPCNMILNYLSMRLDSPKEYDEGGAAAAAGEVIPELMSKLKQLEYYHLPPPKSLSREWFETEMLPIFDNFQDATVPNLLRTAVEHITDELCQALVRNMPDTSAEPVRLENTLLVTGGGALNEFLLKTLHDKIGKLPLPVTLWSPDEETVKFKEAIIFAFLGLRTLLGLTNTFSMDTGGTINSVSGSIHLPPGGNQLLPHLKKNCPFHIMRKISRASVTTFGSTEELCVPGGSDEAPLRKSSKGGTIIEKTPLMSLMAIRERTLTH